MAPVKTENNRESQTQSDEKNWAVFCHLGGLFGLVLPPLNVAIPLIIWLSFRDKYEFVDDQGKEAINFQISLTIYLVAAAILVFIAIGLLLVIGLAVFALIVSVKAALRAGEGIEFRYPITIRFVR
jgi:uncharacterized Tic20 family protein